MKNFVAIDFETANPQRVSACALGYAVVREGEIIESKGFLIKPIGGHAPFQSKIHGITEEHTWDKPHFNEMFNEIESLFSLPLVAHSQFDKQVLNALSNHFDMGLVFEYTDSSLIAKQRMPEMKNHKLKTLAKHFSLPDFAHHDAREDALACANIFLRLHNQESAVHVRTAEPRAVGDFAEFKGMLKGIIADEQIHYKEALQLLYWLEDHPEVQREQAPIYARLHDTLSDRLLDMKEAVELESIFNRLIEEMS